eukprot:837159-Pelagomonas_calceolata.AAC.1
MFKNAGLTPASIESAAWAGIECACCEICNYTGGKKPMNSEPPYLDMNICDACRRTYHWTCMRELGCYTNEQGKNVNNNNYYWACPA